MAGGVQPLVERKQGRLHGTPFGWPGWLGASHMAEAAMPVPELRGSLWLAWRTLKRVLSRHAAILTRA